MAGTGMLLAPVASGLLVAAAGAVAWAATAAGLAPLVVAVLAVGTTALTTRGLHLDGLADTADGLASGGDRDRALAVMRRGDTGPAGAAALVLVLLLQVAALAEVVAAAPAAALVALPASRGVLAVVCARPAVAARPGGLGAAVVGAVPAPAAAAATLLLAALALPVAGWRGPLAVAAAAAVALLLARRCDRRLGGRTGDVLGACVEAGLAAALVVLATGR